MSMEKNINTRIQHKHDIEANWNKALNFIPKAGEIIVYDIDKNYNYSRFKIGDGVRTINNLEFSQTDLTGYATESYVNSAVANLVNSAPEALNTLNELAAALGDDPNFATTIATEIGKKVDKVDGKGLSTHDFTNEYKDKLDSLEIPTKVSELTNDSGYLSSIPSEYVTETELNAKGYLTEHQSLEGYAKTADLGNLASKDTVSKSDLASSVQTSLGKADTALQSYTETDPTVPAWAKASSKPTYTKTEVGLGNVDNVKQYSANNPPPYPVTSVNGATGAVTVKAVPNCSASDNGKFLRVVNGTATWSTVPNAEEATF